MVWSTIVNRKRRSHKDATHTSHAIFGAATSCRATSKTIVRFRVIRKAVCRWKDARLRRYGDRRVIDRSCRKRGGCEQGVDRGSRGEAGMRADSRQSRADRRADRQFLASPPILFPCRSHRWWHTRPVRKLIRISSSSNIVSRPSSIRRPPSHREGFERFPARKNSGKSVWPPFMVGKLYNGIWCAWWSRKVYVDAARIRNNF